MKKYDYDLIVIGAGSGGLAAARYAAKLGKSVAIAEENEIGGTCVNRGCIPTKLMVYASGFSEQQAIAGAYGWVNPEGLFDWQTFRQGMNGYIQSLRKTQKDNLNGIDVLHGKATFSDPHTVVVNEQTVTAEYVLIAVGARPRLPDMRGIELAITSRDIFHLESLPESFLIVGGGYIGVEFSQILANLGCRVTLVESSSKLLDGFDIDVQKRVQEILEADGVTVISGSRLTEIEQSSGTLLATLEDGRSLKAKQVFCALGRTANIKSLNLEDLGVKTKDNKIIVDCQGKTQVTNIFAVGDCTDRMLLTPVARTEACTAVKAMFENSDATVQYQWIPSAIFMHPEIAMVGLSEQEARKQYEEIELHCQTFNPLKYSITSTATEAMIKLIVNPKSQHILGLHLIAPRAVDLVQALVPALKKGLTKAELDETVGIHPSIGEEIFAM